MPDIQIERAHTLGLAEARKVAIQWAQQAEKKFDMECSYEESEGGEQGKEGKGSDLLTFSRSGVSGTLAVTGEHFELNAKLGFLLGAFKERIEAEISKNLDELIATTPEPVVAAKKSSLKKTA
ncbi:MAG: polyhydroxyalkanoic acid synthase [Comamonadaceae bacterium]|nr:MAG: polyhydroxyalkanoic acid synthase [Comamonadaceae bacterium]